MIEGHQGSYDRIKSKTSLKEVLELACSFEASARDFYRDLAPKVSKNIRWLAEDLAAEEQCHYDLLRGLADHPDIVEQIAVEVQTPANNTRFSDAVHLPDLGPRPDDQAVLQYAMGREHIAMEHYQSLAEGTEPGPIRDMFVYLANEETKHKSELEKLYYEMVHSGGV
ncbi:ferritin family protein [Lamprocystis purpurea]|jgi:rubrerythrin|uniref:ferritin family protein n=1 Tax=Lamprocystis purpurea TaxID=61598 RepID=UPI00037E10D1|nr:ferritin family protein [Lamprocystis purpurea]